MKLHIGNLKLTFSFWFFAVLASVAILGRISFAIYALTPVIIHELGHLIAMKACGVKLSGICFSAFGIEILRDEFTVTNYGSEIIVTLGGIAANLLTALACLSIPFKSMRIMLFISSNIAVALFNALPIGDLDGGQLLRLVLSRLGSLDLAFMISRICSFIALIPLFSLSIYLIICGNANITILVACIYLTGAVICQKI